MKTTVLYMVDVIKGTWTRPTLLFSAAADARSNKTTKGGHVQVPVRDQ